MEGKLDFSNNNEVLNNNVDEQQYSGHMTLSWFSRPPEELCKSHWFQKDGRWLAMNVHKPFDASFLKRFSDVVCI